MPQNMLFLFVFFPLFSMTFGYCPSQCECDFNDLGMKRIRCEFGGTKIPQSFTFSTLGDVEVLIVTSSKNGAANEITLDKLSFLNMQLRELRLKHSVLFGLADRVFKSLGNTLEILDLSHNNIPGIMPDYFFGLTRLTSLHLDYNNIVSAPSMDLLGRYLSNLKTLTMSNNAIEYIPQPDHQKPSNLLLEILDLSYNPLGEADMSNDSCKLANYIFEDYPMLTHLNLANTSICNFPWNQVQKYNPQLVHLDLSFNHFEEIPELLQLTRLRNVSFRENPIKFISPNAFRELYFEQLDLGALPAAAITPEVFNNDVKIAKLIISDITAAEPGLKLKLSDLLRSRTLTEELTSLDISNNSQLLVSGRMFEGLPALQELKMERMGLHYLASNIFQAGKEISSLSLADNRFKEITGAVFSPLVKLKRLDLSRNLLQKIPLVLATTKLEEIDLRGNRLQSFPEELVELFSNFSINLHTLALHGNPWKCDCGIAGLVRWLISTSEGNDNGFRVVCSVFGQNNSCPICYAPGSLRDVPLNTLPARVISFESCPVGEPNQGFDGFQCWECESPVISKCIHESEMKSTICSNVFGKVTSCYQRIDDSGIKRGCGAPEEDASEYCDHNLGQFRNETFCICRANLCNSTRAPNNNGVVFIISMVMLLISTLNVCDASH